MELAIEFGKLLIPAGLVLYAMYLTVKSFLRKEVESQLLNIRSRNNEVVVPIRLQAYERMCLFLERITPNNLIPRVSHSKFSAKEFQAVLLQEIREEYNHNLSQQMYMTDESWQLIKNAMEEVIMVINESAEGLKEDAKGLDLAKIIFENIMNRKIDPVAYPLKFLKDEIRELF